MSALNALVAEAVDLVVHLERTMAGIQVTAVLAVEDQVGGPEAVQFTATELFARPRPRAAAQWTGHQPLRAAHKLAAAGIDLIEVLGDGRSSAVASVEQAS